MSRLELLVASETEFSLLPPESRSIQAMDSEGFEKVSCSPAPTASERQLIQDAREDAKDMLATLVPTSDEEADRLALWKSQVPDFTISDAANFRVYERLSVPTLSYKQSTVGMTRSQTEAVSPGEVEFRFGPGILQEGYYDEPDVSELRLNPRSYALYPARRKMLRRVVGNVAAQHRMVAYAGTEHLSMSAYNGERPYLGDPREDIEPYVAVAGGLRRVMHEGVLYDPDRNPAMPKHLEISPWRDTTDVRMMPARFEFRGFCYQPEKPETLFGINPLRALKFMKAGMEYGLLHATDADKQPIQRITTLATRPDAGYNRSDDLSVQRFVGAMRLHEDGSVVMAHYLDNIGGALERLSGQPGLYPDRKVLDNLIATMHVKDGHVQVQDDRLSNFRLKLPGVAGLGWLRLNAHDMNARLRRVAVEPVPGVAWIGDVQGPDDVLANIAQATALRQVAPEQFSRLARAAAQNPGK